MAVEIRARNLVITDARDAFAYRRYVKGEEGSLARLTKAMWIKQGAIVTPDTMKIALNAGTVPDVWKDPWSRITREYVRDDMTKAWVKSISTAGDMIAKKVNRLQRKQFEFDSTMAAIKAWIDANAGSLIVNLTAGQLSSIHALLQSQIALGVTSPYILAQRIKPMVGLTEREARAVAKFIASLTEDGVAANAINKQADKYAKYLHRNRAARIAQTELANAYGAGEMASMKQAVAEGWLPGVPEKSWLAGGPNPCEICEENEAAGAIPLEEAFPSGDQQQTAHPSCACAVSYQVRR